MAKAAPRAVRNNNPGNIDRCATPWQGEDRSSSAKARESRFCVFTSAEAGFRALARVLLTYREKHRLRTVAGIVARWAPPVENNTGAYARQVAAAVGVDPDQVIDVRDPEVMFKVVKAIARHESGGNYWSDATIRTGLGLAGVV